MGYGPVLDAVRAAPPTDGVLQLGNDKADLIETSAEKSEVFQFVQFRSPGKFEFDEYSKIERDHHYVGKDHYSRVRQPHCDPRENRKAKLRDRFGKVLFLEACVRYRKRIGGLPPNRLPSNAVTELLLET